MQNHQIPSNQVHFGSLFRRTLHSLLSPKILGTLILPVILALVLWIVTLVVGWSSAETFFVSLFQNYIHKIDFGLFQFLANLFSTEVTTLYVGLSNLLLICLTVPLFVVYSIFISSLLLGVLLQKIVFQLEYPNLKKREGGSQIGGLLFSLKNTFMAFVIWALLLILCAPLYLIPGLQVLVPMALNGWFNSKVFAFDVLLDYASTEQIKSIRRKHSRTLYLAGFASGALYYIPIINLLAPAVASILFIHLCAGLLIEEKLIEEKGTP